MLELVLHDRVARLTLERPPVNAISSEWLAIFHRRLDELDQRDDWQVLHIRSSQKVFCAGADLAEMRQQFAGPAAWRPWCKQPPPCSASSRASKHSRR